MPTYAPLTDGLKHVNRTTELQPGEVYIARFKNALQNYRADIWICVVLPDNFEEGRGLARRPKGSKPLEPGTTWTTPLHERVYPVYLPGQNSFRWVPITDLFILEDRIPDHFAKGSERDGAKEFRQLLKIVRQNPGLEFWKAMAHKETQAKGKRGRFFRVILPDGYGNMLDEDSSESSDEAPAALNRSAMNPISTNGISSNSMAVPFHSAPAAGTGNAKNPIALSFPGEPAFFLSYSKGTSTTSSDAKRSWAQFSLDKDSSHASVRRPRPSAPFIPSPYSQRANSSNTPEIVLKTELDEDRKANAFDLDLRTALRHIFLQESDMNDIIAIFDDAIMLTKTPGFKLVGSWLQSREFAPCLVQVNDRPLSTAENQGQSTDDATPQRQIGDIQGIHRKYRLATVSDSKVLREIIISLGNLYFSIRRFSMEKLVDLITLKLQVAWNSYPGITQLEPLLEVASFAFSVQSLKRDAMQKWLVSFLADTYDLYTCAYPTQLWKVLNDNQVLYEEFRQKRKELHRENPERYEDVMVLLQSRGLERC